MSETLSFTSTILEPDKVKRENPRPDPGYLTRDFEIVDLAVEAAGLLGLVLPGDAEEVRGIDIP